MIYFLFVSPLVYVPGLIDLFTLPKTLYLSLLGIPAIYWLLQAKRWPLVYILFAYLLLILVSGYQATNLVTFYQQISLDLLGVIFFYYVVNFVKIDQIVPYLRFLFFVSLAVGLFIMLSPILQLSDISAGTGGPQGNPSFAALVLGLGFVIGLTQGYPYLALSLLVPLYLTGSLATLLGLLLALVVCGVYSVRQRLNLKPLQALFATAGTFIAVTAIVYPFLPFAQESLNVRTGFWQSSLKMFLDFPFFGVGRGNSTLIFPVYSPPHYGRLASAMHNDFFQILVETGPLTLIIFCFLLGYLFFGLIALRPERTRLALTGFLSVYLSHLFFNFPLELPEQNVILWTLMGFSWIVIHEKNHPHHSPD